MWQVVISSVKVRKPTQYKLVRSIEYKRVALVRAVFLTLCDVFLENIILLLLLEKHVFEKLTVHDFLNW